MENELSDYIGLVVLFAGGAAVVWYFWTRITAWWHSK